MDFKYELTVIPVSDVDRSKEFYAEKLGFNLDVDHGAGDAFRVVQLTPPGSAASITIGKGIPQAEPGTYQGMHLVVEDLPAARQLLVERGVDVSEPFHDVTGIFHHAGTEGRVDGPAPEHADYGSFLAFSDPDGNGWLLQEIKTRLPGR